MEVMPSLSDRLEIVEEAFDAQHMAVCRLQARASVQQLEIEDLDKGLYEAHAKIRTMRFVVVPLVVMDVIALICWAMGL